MKKLFLLLMMLVLVPMNALAKEIVDMYYIVPDSFLLCQNKRENLESGTKSFEKFLKSKYKDRFEISKLQRLYDSDLDTSLIKDKNVYVLYLEVGGEGQQVVTFQNVFGAQESINAPTIKINYQEAYGLKSKQEFYGTEDDTYEYVARAISVYGVVGLAEHSQRHFFKNAVQDVIRALTNYNPPSPYTSPKENKTYNELFYFTNDLAAAEFYDVDETATAEE